jgi:hypothetical protein
MSRKTALTPLTAYERETVITFSDADELATIVTHQRKTITKLEHNPLARKVEDLPHGSQPGGRFELPKELLTFRTKKRGAPKRPFPFQNGCLTGQNDDPDPPRDPSQGGLR